MGVLTEQTAQGEIKVETGTGIVSVDDPGDKRNAQVKIKATHVQLSKPVTAWVDTQGPLWPATRDAAQQGTEVEYRVEVKRKRSIDPAIPFADLTSDQKVRDLAAMAPKGAQLPAANGTPESRPAEPAPTPPPAEPAPTPPPAEASDSEPACALCGIQTFADPREAVEHGGSMTHRANVEKARRQQADRAATTFDDSAGPRDRTVPPAAKRGPRMEEGRPWELYNTDGTLNLASYSYTAVIGFVELAHYLISQRVADVQASGGETPEFRLGQVDALARMLLDAADRCQAANRQDGRVDRMDASHTRARGAVRTALKVYPVPWGAAPDVRTEWLDHLSEHAAAIMRIAFDLFRFHETGAGQ